MGRPLLERKARLETLLNKPPAGVRYSEHMIGNGAAMLAEAAKLRVEGIVSKRIDHHYLPGNRGAWVKTKCLNPARVRCRRLDRSGGVALVDRRALARLL